MNNKTRVVIAIILSVTIFITPGCQIASHILSTPTPAPTLTPVNTPTKMPTLTPKPISDLSSAVLTLDDLPPGFEEYTLDEFGISADDFSNEDFQPKDVFIFVNPQDFQIVFGFNSLLTEKIDRAAFDVAMLQPEITLPVLVNGMGPENVHDEKLLEGMEDIGEVQMGMTMIANMEGVPAQVDVLMFRRNIIGAMVMSIVLEGQSPNITIHDLGLKLDQNIQDNLDTIE